MKKWIFGGSFIILVLCGIFLFIVGTQKNKVINVGEGLNGSRVSINIDKGKNYLHDFKVNSFLRIKTPPQMAVWVEDTQGNYLETLYATSKIVHQNWSKAPTDPAQKGQIQRAEALPYWTHKRGNLQMADTITSATPKGSTMINTKIGTTKDSYVVLAEINMSTDFNEYYPKDAKPGEDSYSGGEFGSGQPAIVYTVTVNAGGNKTYELVPIGYSSPDGKDGNLYRDLSKLDTAKDIVSKITLTIK